MIEYFKSPFLDNDKVNRTTTTTKRKYRRPKNKICELEDLAYISMNPDIRG